MRKGLWALWFTWFFLNGSPLWAQTIPVDFHAWFLNAVAGKPFGQQTLLELAPQLPCVGSMLTPPNAAGERTKIWDTDTRTWTRVGFGEGVWVWIHQAPAAPPVITEADMKACSQPSPTPQPVPIPSVDFSAVLARIDFVYQQLYAQQERTHADAVARDAALSAQIKMHDDKPSELAAVFGNRYVQLALTALSSYLTTRQVMK